MNKSPSYLAYLRLARVHKPAGYFLLLAPVIWTLWLVTDGEPPLATTIIFIIGVLLMRSAGCVINDYIDRDLDRLVTRTRERPIANGDISPHQALMFFSILIALAFILVCMTNVMTILMSLPALVLAISYPLAKRWHSLPQIHLGLAFGWAIPMVWTATHQSFDFPLTVWLLYIANIIWVLAYDTIYAMADCQDDQQVGIKSSALLFGAYARHIIALLQLAFLLLLLVIGYLNHLGMGYYIGLLLSLAMFVWQHILMIKSTSMSSYIRAFSNNTWVGLIIFIGIWVTLKM